MGHHFRLIKIIGIIISNVLFEMMASAQEQGRARPTSVVRKWSLKEATWACSHISWSPSPPQIYPSPPQKYIYPSPPRIYIHPYILFAALDHMIQWLTWLVWYNRLTMIKVWKTLKYTHTMKFTKRYGVSEWVSEWVSDKHSQWSDSGPIKTQSLMCTSN